MSERAWNLNKGYARTNFRDGDRQKTVLLHQFIASRMGIVGQADHRDRNKLNCQRGNLRPCTQQQNTANQGVRRTNKLGVKGVSRYRDKYKAEIMVGGKKMYVGLFSTVSEASDAYYATAQQHSGEFACRG